MAPQRAICQPSLGSSQHSKQHQLPLQDLAQEQVNYLLIIFSLTYMYDYFRLVEGSLLVYHRVMPFATTFSNHHGDDTGIDAALSNSTQIVQRINYLDFGKKERYLENMAQFVSSFSTAFTL